MFQPGVNDEQARVTALALSGEMLYALTRECVRQGNAKILWVLKDAGRFDFKLDDCFGIARTNDVMCTGQALPMIDALGVMMGICSRRRIEFVRDNGLKNNAIGYQSCLTQRDGMATVIREICLHAVSQFRALDPTFADKGEKREFDRVRESTMAVIGAIACASNDVQLATKAQCCHGDALGAVMDGRMIQEVLQHGHGKALDFAFRYASVDVLKEIDASRLVDLLKDELVISRGDVNDSNDFCDWHQSGPFDPAMLVQLIQKMTQTDSSATGESLYESESSVTKWIDEVFLPQVCGGGGEYEHALELILEKVPEVFDLNFDRSLDLAAEFAEPRVMAYMLRNCAGLPEITKADDELQALAIVSPEHPLVELLVCAKSVRQVDLDASMLCVLKHMVRVGQGEALRDERLRCTHYKDDPVLHLLMGHKLHQSALFMLEHGVNPRVKNTSGHDAIEFALARNNEEGALLIRSFAARQQARLAIDGIDMPQRVVDSPVQRNM